METVTLRVPDVSCEHCVRTIDQTLSPIAGVSEVRTDIASKTVTLTYDPARVGLDAIEQALAEADYPVAN